MILGVRESWLWGRACKHWIRKCSPFWILHWFHGTESLEKWSKNSPHFTEPEGPLPCLDDTASGSYPESHVTSYFFNIHFNIIFPSTIRSLKVVSTCPTFLGLITAIYIYEKNASYLYFIVGL